MKGLTMNTVLSEALRDFTGLLKQLLTNLLGNDAEMWGNELKKFLRKEPCWVKAEEAVQQAQETAKEIAKRTLIAWKTFTIGGIPKKELPKRVAESCEEVGDYAKDLMKQSALVTSETATEVDFVVLSIAELGFTRNPRTDQWMTKEFCAEWSAKHLDGQAIELCQPEDGPHIRIHYKDQRNGEILWMAMERITDSDGDPLVFVVERDDDGKRWLSTDWVSPSGTWDLDLRVVFRLRKLPSPSAA